MKITELMIGAESFDEALAEARKIDPRYNGGKIVETDHEEDQEGVRA